VITIWAPYVQPIHSRVLGEKTNPTLAAKVLPVLGKFRLADAKTKLPGSKWPAAGLQRMNESRS
jgi:hypothetical protein